jgi:hypothetical protein
MKPNFKMKKLDEKYTLVELLKAMNDERGIEKDKGNGVLPSVSRSFIGLFMHYDNGDMINIQDLPKPEYQKFLEQMNALRMAYITLVSRP